MDDWAGAAERRRGVGGGLRYEMASEEEGGESEVRRVVVKVSVGAIRSLFAKELQWTGEEAVSPSPAVSVTVRVPSWDAEGEGLAVEARGEATVRVDGTVDYEGLEGEGQLEVVLGEHVQPETILDWVLNTRAEVEVRTVSEEENGESQVVVVGTGEVDLAYLVLNGDAVGSVAEGLGVPVWDDSMRIPGEDAPAEVTGEASEAAPAELTEEASGASGVSLVSSTVNEGLMRALAVDLPEEMAPRQSLSRFCSVFAPLVSAGPEGKAARDEVFFRGWLDPNGNGFVSLAEADGWVLVQLTHALKDEVSAGELWRRFRPSFIHAFNDAKDVKRGSKAVLKGAETATEDDYVTRSELRILCAYLCLYAIMFDAFSLLDQSTGEIADRRVNLEQLRAGMDKLSHYPLVALKQASTEEDVEALFTAMDADGHGMILFKEFAQYVEAREIDAGTEVGLVLTLNEEELVEKRREEEAAQRAKVQEVKDAAEKAALDADAPRRLATGVKITPKEVEVVREEEHVEEDHVEEEGGSREDPPPSLLCEGSARASVTVSLEGLEWLIPEGDVGRNNVAEIEVAVAGVPDSCTGERGFDLEVAVGLDESEPLILRLDDVERFEVPGNTPEQDTEAEDPVLVELREKYAPLLEGQTSSTSVTRLERRRHYLRGATVDALREEVDMLHKFWSAKGFYRVRPEREGLRVEVRRTVKDPMSLRDGFQRRYTAQGSVSIASLNPPLSLGAEGAAALVGLEGENSEGIESLFWKEEEEEEEEEGEDPETKPEPEPEPVKGKGKAPPAPKGPVDVGEVEADGMDPWGLAQGRVHVSLELLAPLVPAYPDKPAPVLSVPLAEMVGYGTEKGVNEKYVKDCTELFLAHVPGTVRPKFDTLSGFERFVNLESLWVSGTNVEALTGLEHNFRIVELRAAGCWIESLKGSSLPKLRFLRHLSLERNYLADLQETVGQLAGFNFLEYLNLSGNPCASGSPAYRRYVVYHCKQLKTLDLHEVTDAERKAAKLEYGDSDAVTAATVGFGTRFIPKERKKVKPGTPSATEKFVVAQAAKIRAKREEERLAEETKLREQLAAEEAERMARYTGSAPMAAPPLLQ